MRWRAGSMERREFRFAQIVAWIRQHIKPLRQQPVMSQRLNSKVR